MKVDFETKCARPWSRFEIRIRWREVVIDLGPFGLCYFGRHDKSDPLNQCRVLAFRFARWGVSFSWKMW